MRKYDSPRLALPATRPAILPVSPRATLAATLLASVLVAGCDAGTAERASDDHGEPPVILASLTSPAPAGSAEPNLTVGPDGFYLSWIERLEEGGHALRFATLPVDPGGAEAAGDAVGAGGPGGAGGAGGAGESGWSEPRTILEREGLFVNWADFPSLLALDNGLMAAHWLQKSGPGTYSYDVRTAISTDGGAAWGEDVIPHRDGVEAEHGFVSLMPEGDRVGAVWLDGRETVNGGPMTLRYATLDPQGAGPERLLDESVCECCQTAGAIAADGPVVLYRDRTDDEIRDIYVVRRVDGEWTEPAPVHADGWHINACPVNGPAIDADGERVVAAWFTGADPEGPRVLVAFSDDGGATFGPPVRLDEGGALGRVDVLLLDDGSALASWVASGGGGGGNGVGDGGGDAGGGGDGAGILLRRVAPGEVGSMMQIRTTSPERASGFPRMARSGDQVLFAWTEAGDDPRVNTAIGRITEGPMSGSVATR